MADKMEEITVKVYFNGTSNIRRFSLPIKTGGKNYDDTYFALMKKMEQLNPFDGDSSLQLTWKDGDGDLITMDKGEELKEAVRNNGDILRIYADVVDVKDQAKMGKGQVRMEKSATVIYHTIESKLHGKVMTVRDGRAESCTPIVMWNKDANPPPKALWHFEPAGGGRFYIVSALDRNMVMEVQGEKFEDGTSVILWPRKSPPNNYQQLFRWNGDYIESCVAKGKMLDVLNGNESDAVGVQIFHRTDGKWKYNQRWLAISY